MSRMINLLGFLTLAALSLNTPQTVPSSQEPPRKSFRQIHDEAIEYFNTHNIGQANLLKNTFFASQYDPAFELWMNRHGYEDYTEEYRRRYRLRQQTSITESDPFSPTHQSQVAELPGEPKSIPDSVPQASRRRFLSYLGSITVGLVTGVLGTKAKEALEGHPVMPPAVEQAVRETRLQSTSLRGKAVDLALQGIREAIVIFPSGDIGFRIKDRSGRSVIVATTMGSETFGDGNFKEAYGPEMERLSPLLDGAFVLIVPPDSSGNLPSVSLQSTAGREEQIPCGFYTRPLDRRLREMGQRAATNLNPGIVEIPTGVLVEGSTLRTSGELGLPQEGEKGPGIVFEWSPCGPSSVHRKVLGVQMPWGFVSADRLAMEIDPQLRQLERKDFMAPPSTAEESLPSLTSVRLDGGE